MKDWGGEGHLGWDGAPALSSAQSDLPQVALPQLRASKGWAKGGRGDLSFSLSTSPVPDFPSL